MFEFLWAEIANAPSVQTLVYNRRFPGQYFDVETGLHENHHRTYDPKLGRYTQPEPLGLAAGKNPFNYGNQNPLNATDPYGLERQTLSSPPRTGNLNPPSTSPSDGTYNCYAAIGENKPPAPGLMWIYHHAYTCVIANGKADCRGLMPDQSTVGYLGNVVQETYLPQLCKKIRDEPEYGACIKDQWGPPKHSAVFFLRDLSRLQCADLCTMRT